MKRLAVVLGVAILLWLAWAFLKWIQRPREGVELPPTPRDVGAVMDALSPVMEPLWRARFRKAGLEFPGEQLWLVGLKAERRLEVVAVATDGTKQIVANYPVLAASGTSGPKLREGDRQVPEGDYPIVRLNPNSRFHLSFEIGYPNAHDVTRALTDGRDVNQLGGEIMVHGNAVSVGCLAVGDSAIEELFYLVARMGLDRVRILVVPCDFRVGASPQVPDDAPAWTSKLHSELREQLAVYPRP